MGATHPKLHKAVEIELLKRTKFDAHELRVWYHQFMVEYPSGKITKGEFIRVNLSFANFGNAELWGHIFDIIDTDKSGEISFAEWVSLLSCINRGSTSEQIELMFKLYDLDGNGSLQKNEIQKIIEFLHRFRHFEKPAEEITDEVFDALDANHDGKITLHEFVHGFHNHPEIGERLNVMDCVFSGFRQLTEQECLQIPSNINT
eukprot:TRINITY_DN6549_c0_g1_i1.p2 TRINITY_DN6549_c0_g1~~TRINITY_DN6549_c0_g1_i1.p2  ORF type:complete len:218 (-),score=88.32 TRINITY_DN6549_c0_g1_i1:17-625(-)